MSGSTQVQIKSRTLVKVNENPANSLYRLYGPILIALLLVAAPFLLFPEGYRLLALLILPAIWLVRWVLVKGITPRTPLDWPVLLVLIMVLVSLWATYDLRLSIGKIAGLLLGITLYYAIVDLANTKRSLKKVIAVFVLSGVALAVVALLGARWPEKFPLIEPFLGRVPRIFQGVPGAEQGFHPNQVAGVLVFYVPLQVVLFGHWLERVLFRARGGFHPDSSHQGGRGDQIRGVLTVTLVGLSLLATAGVLLLTQSRGAIGGLVVGLVFVAAIRTRWGKAVAIGCLIFVLVAVSAGLVDELVTSGVETEAVGAIGLASRLEIWSRALQGTADFPLGMGMNAFRHVVPVLYPLFTLSSDFDFGHAHNHFLQATLDLGVPGLIAYLAIWLGAGFLLGQTVSGSRSPFYRGVALGLIGGFIAYFTYGITDAVALGAKPGFVFWWALGLVVATHRLFYRDRVTL